MTAPLTRLPSYPPPPDILLIEDSPPDAELIVRSFREVDPVTRIDIARDGEEALDYLLGRGGFRNRLGAPLPRLVLLDLKLPKLDGLEVLRGLRANSRTCLAPVVVLSSSTDPRQLAQCYQLGANGYVQKPVRYEEFLHAMQTVGRYWLGLNQTPAVTVT